MSHRYDVLRGLRVIDLGIITAGASTTAMLADLGADVVKVEGPSYVDPFRNWFGEANTPNWWNESPQFIATNRNKRGICLDLKSPVGRELLLSMVAGADIVVENFRAGVLDKLGIGYAVLAGVNPRIIVASISSQGATGPNAQNVSFGSTLEASSGMAHLTRYTGEKPNISGRGLNYPDQVVSLFAASAVLAAVVERNRTGRGSHLDLSQRELTTYLIGEAMLAGAASDEPENPVDCGTEFQGIFVASDNTHLAVTIPEASAARVAALLALEGAKGAEGAEATLAQWICARRADDAAIALRSIGVAAEPVIAGKDRNRSPLANGNAFSRDANGVSVKGLPIRIGGKDITGMPAAPSLGQHNREIARELLELDDAQFAALAADGVFGDRPAKARR